MSHLRRPIGVFDSGVGGLTVLKELRASLPGERFLYLGDTARVPYGTKDPSTVERYALQIARRLEGEGCKAIVVACNTASAMAIDALRRDLSLPVIDVIAPLCADPHLAEATRQPVAVLGTRGTVRSGAYLQRLTQRFPGRTILQQACPLFVPLVEEGWADTPIAREVAGIYLRELLAGGDFHHLILGCTHYPRLRGSLSAALAALGKEAVAVHESGPATAKALRDALAAAELLATPGEPVDDPLRVVVTDNPGAFVELAASLLGVAVPHAEHIDL